MVLHLSNAAWGAYQWWLEFHCKYTLPYQTTGTADIGFDIEFPDWEM